MVRLIKQTTLSNCGPTALLNALRLTGINSSVSDYPFFYSLAKTDVDGTSDDNLIKAFKVFKHWTIKSTVPSIFSIKKSLSQGNLVLVGYPAIEIKGRRKEISGHYILLSDYRDNKFLSINHISPKDFNLVSKSSKHLIKTQFWTPEKEISSLLKPVYLGREKERPLSWSISLF